MVELSFNQSNFYSANIPGEARLSGAQSLRLTTDKQTSKTTLKSYNYLQLRDEMLPIHDVMLMECRGSVAASIKHVTIQFTLYAVYL